MLVVKSPGPCIIRRVESYIMVSVRPPERLLMSQTATPTARSHRILLVEDHGDTREALSKLLTLLGHSVYPAGDADAALGIAAIVKLDLVISDVGLPGKSGLSLMAELKRQYGLKGIAMTGYGSDADVEACSVAGFSQHLLKPVDMAILAQSIEKLFA